MPSKTIGPAGARLLTALAERDRPIFSVAEAQAVLGSDYDAVVHTLRRLQRAGWVVRLTAGRYAMVPLSSGSTSAPQVNRYVIMRELLAPAPYYISHDSAMDIHDMLTRPVTDVTATSPRRLAGRTILGIPYRFIYAPPAALWGHTPVWVTPYEQVAVSDWNGPCWTDWPDPISAPASARSPRRYGCATPTWIGSSWEPTPKSWADRLRRSASVTCSNCSNWARRRCLPGCKR